MDLQVITAIIFVIFLSIFLYKKRSHIVLQKVLFPFLYLILYRSDFGVNFIDKFAKKHKEGIKFFGYSCIGLSIVGMIFISVNIIMMIYNMIVQPVAQPGVALVLPFTNVPGIGYLSFFHWIIAIFFLAIIHEFCHGIVAKAHGLHIKSTGFAFFSILAPIIPAAFVEPDEKKLEKESDVVQYSVFSAGPIINIIAAVLIALLIMPAFSGIEQRITDPDGFAFSVIEGDYPVADAGIKDGIIQAVNREKVTDFDSFIDITYGVKPGEEFILLTDQGEYTLTTVASPDNPKKGFIGIMPVENKRKPKPEYAWISSPFNWTKDLFRWLFLLNFFIGLFNLLPLGIVDGGRILKTFLNKVMEDKQKAQKIWGFISFLFLAMLLFGLLTTYFGNPFALLK